MENSTTVLGSNLNQNNDKPWPIAVKFGIAGAVFYIFTSLITYLSGAMDIDRMMENAQGGFDFGSIMTSLGLGLLNYVVFTVIYYLAIAAYRKELGGFITFGGGFKVAFFSALIKAVVVFFWSLIFFYFICPEYCEGMLNLMAENMQQGGGIDENAMETVMNIYSYMFNPIFMAISAAMVTISGGALLSLVAAMFGQKEPTT